MTPMGVGPDAQWCPDCEARLDLCHCRKKPPAEPRKVCTRDVSNLPLHDQVCDDCGHWNGAHPMSRSSVTECLICVLVNTLARVEEQLLYPPRQVSVKGALPLAYPQEGY